MSLLNRILKHGGKVGWVAVDATPEGLFGVSVMAPQVAGDKPGVVGCGAVAGAALDAQSLISLAKSVSAADFPWTVPLVQKTYNILVVEEPAVRPEEMEESVRWAVTTLIDYPIADAYVSWMRIPTQKLQPNRPPHMYAVVARHETVDAYRDVFKQAKLPLRAVDVRETAHRNIAAMVAKQGEGVVMVSVGRHGVQLTVTFQGELYLDRYIDETVFSSDAGDDTSAERARERVVLQVQRSLDFVSRTLPFIDINRVVLAPMPAESNLREKFAENLPVPVESIDLGTVFDFSRTPQLSREENQASYFVALGAALRFMSNTG